MLLSTTDQLREALRQDAKVIVLFIDDAGNKRLDGYGTLIDVRDETVSILNTTVGVLSFLRENVEVHWVRT